MKILLFFGPEKPFLVENDIFGQKFAIIRSRKCHFGHKNLWIKIQTWSFSGFSFEIGYELCYFWSFLDHFRVNSGSFLVILIILDQLRVHVIFHEVIFGLKDEILTIFEKILEMDSSTLNINFSVVC